MLRVYSNSSGVQSILNKSLLWWGYWKMNIEVHWLLIMWSTISLGKHWFVSSISPLLLTSESIREMKKMYLSISVCNWSLEWVFLMGYLSCLRRNFTHWNYLLLYCWFGSTLKVEKIFFKRYQGQYVPKFKLVHLQVYFCKIMLWEWQL